MPETAPPFFVSPPSQPPAAPEPLAGAPLRLDWVRDAAGLEHLKPHWDQLLERSAIRSPFLRWEWVKTWWRHFGSGRELSVAVLRGADDVPVMIAPMMISPGEGRLRRYLRWLTWVGGLGPVTGERMDFLVPPEHAPMLMPWLQRIFAEVAADRNVDALWLPMVPEESPNLPWLHEALAASWLGVGVGERLASRCMVLPHAWENLPTGAAGRWRKKMRRKNAAFFQRHSGQRVQAELMLEPMAAFDELARLHALHWPVGVSNFLRPENWAFHRELAGLWLKEGRAVMPGLLMPEGWAALLYGFIEGEEFFFYQHGWEEKLASLSPGNLAVKWSIELANRLGLKLYDMLPGEQTYKAEWCQERRTLLHVEAVCARSLKGRWYGRLFRRGVHSKLPSRTSPGSAL